MIKNKLRLTLKLFIILWVLLFLQIILKLTFNYWQPYVIPTPQLETISNFIDNNLWLKIIIDKIFWIIGVYFMVLSGIQQWRFKHKYQIIIILICSILSAIDGYYKFLDTIIDNIISIFVLICLPLIINHKKWLTILLTFIFSYIYLYLSLWLEDFTNTDDMRYIIGTFFNIDYYIMLILNYMVFNLIRIGKEKKQNG